MFRRVSDSASKGVLGVLKSVCLGFRKVKVQRVTVVEFGMYDRGGDGVGCLVVKIGANAAQLTNVSLYRVSLCQLIMMTSRCLSPMKRNSVFEELRVRGTVVPASVTPRCLVLS